MPRPTATPTATPFPVPGLLQPSDVTYLEHGASENT